MMVHMSGAPGDVEAVQAIAKKKGLWLLEDCAQCAGGTVGGRRVGTFGDIATFSFQINKNMTSGEGGCVITNDERLYRRAFASHDLGYARNEAGRLILDDPSLQIWGRGYRMDEMRAAVLRVQLRRLPATIATMRASKHRIRAALERFPAVRLRRLIDPAGDTGPFLITTYRDGETARRVSDALWAEGIRTGPQGVTNIVMTQWGLHLYYNIPSLQVRASVDASGFPWSLAANAGLGGDYAKGACPSADALFERSVLIAIPPCLTRQDEDDIIRAFEKVLPAMAGRGAAGGK
jgi:8-amino-3,8-dideoxy-alpha-D-manno-octulosonate transaminase